MTTTSINTGTAINASAISIRNDRIKTINITSGDSSLGVARFNPYDMSIYKKYMNLLSGIERDEAKRAELSRELQKIERECDELEGRLPKGEELEAAQYEQYSEYYKKKQQRLSMGLQLGGKVDSVFEEMKKGIDGIFGDGVYDILTQGYQDEGMIAPLLEAAKPFFDEAAKERDGQVKSAKLNREQRRARAVKSMGQTESSNA